MAADASRDRDGHAGHPDATLVLLADALLADPSDAERRDRFVTGLRRSRPPGASHRVDRALDLIVGDDAVDVQRLVPTMVHRLRLEPAVARALRAVAEAGELTSDVVTDDLYRALSAPLPLRQLRDAVVADDDVEALLTALRRHWLLARAAQEEIAWPRPELVAAVGLQMLTTEWVYDETAEEAGAVRDLEDELRDASATPAGANREDLLVYALYRPLATVLPRPFPALDGAEPAAVQQVYRRHLAEPAEERRLAAGLPRLTPITDPVSVRVRRQYETLPYPRWHAVPRRSPRPVGDVVARALDRPDLRGSVTAPHPRVLIAGCGTGRHAIGAAIRYAGSRVLAVDLSLVALGFAARQARDLGIDTIEFAQADILELEGLRESFDVVESSGVLHHLVEPETGWAILRGLVRPGGLMKLGLYSRRGRSVLDPVRDKIRAAGIQPTLAGIRSVRNAVRRLPDDVPARRLTAGPDFYSVSGCRDMLFNVHEDPFDIPRIATALRTLRLEFLGFELADPRIRTLFRRHFPDDPLAVDLRNWHDLERRYRYLFASMYRFWCRAGDARSQPSDEVSGP